MEVILDHIAEGIDLVGVAIILWGFSVSLVQLLIVLVKYRSGREFFVRTEALRCQLGTYLMLALEFMIASDVIMTVTSPSREELITVGVLVAVRTAIGYFLGKELKEAMPAAE